jgi:hypothetical protein
MGAFGAGRFDHVIGPIGATIGWNAAVRPLMKRLVRVRRQEATSQRLRLHQ